MLIYQHYLNSDVSSCFIINWFKILLDLELSFSHLIQIELDSNMSHLAFKYPLPGTCGESMPRQNNKCHDFSDCILSAIPNSILASEDYSNALVQEPETNSRRAKKMLSCAEGYIPTHKGHSNTTGNFWKIINRENKSQLLRKKRFFTGSSSSEKIMATF